MHIPKAFREDNPARIVDLIRANPLGAVILPNAEEVEINHIPFVCDELEEGGLRLRAHIPKINPIVAMAQSPRRCAVIFQGANGYVTPSWYVTKQEHGKAVPTWNYSVVHVHGELTLRLEPEWVRSQLEDLTSAHESGREEPWQISDAPADYTDRQFSALVGLEILATEIAAKNKASQNQPDRNRESVMRALEEEQAGSAFQQMMQLHNPRQG